MERGSDQHSPRVDDEMEKEVQSILKGSPVDSRVEPHRKMEDVADLDPDATLHGGEEDELAEP